MDKVPAPTIQCIHNARCRYTEGFLCEDCNTFFGVSTPTYRSTELLSNLSLVLHNINVDLSRKGLPLDDDVKSLCDELCACSCWGVDTPGGFDVDYEALIEKAVALAVKYGKNSKSATVVINHD